MQTFILIWFLSQILVPVGLFLSRTSGEFSKDESTHMAAGGLAVLLGPFALLGMIIGYLYKEISGDAQKKTN